MDKSGEYCKKYAAAAAAVCEVAGHGDVGPSGFCACCYQDTTPAPDAYLPGCEHQDVDGCCLHPDNLTPECHINACPPAPDASAIELIGLFYELGDGVAFSADNTIATFRSKASSLAFKQAAPTWTVQHYVDAPDASAEAHTCFICGEEFTPGFGTVADGFATCHDCENENELDAMHYGG